jgi:predicted transcriptional regulator
VSFRINQGVVKTLDDVAKKEDRSRASVIRRLLVKFHEELGQTA